NYFLLRFSSTASIEYLLGERQLLLLLANTDALISDSRACDVDETGGVIFLI
ncbi:hypothetical protein CEXT_390471, partial [Caerostris extrusa]